MVKTCQGRVGQIVLLKFLPNEENKCVETKQTRNQQRASEVK